MITESKMKPSEVLHRSIERLKTKGWRADGSAMTGTGEHVPPPHPNCGPLCAINTIDAIAFTSADNGRAALNYLKAAVYGRYNPADYQPITSWNDSQRSVEPVLAAFEKAIQLAEAAGE